MGKQFWSQIKLLSKYKVYNSIPTLKVDNVLYESDEDKANSFARHFLKTYTPQNYTCFDDTNFANTNMWYQQYFANNLEDEEEVENIGELEYYEVLYHGKNSAPGYDMATRKIVRSLEPHTHTFIIMSLPS